MRTELFKTNDDEGQGRTGACPMVEGIRQAKERITRITCWNALVRCEGFARFASGPSARRGRWTTSFRGSSASWSVNAAIPRAASSRDVPRRPNPRRDSGRTAFPRLGPVGSQPRHKLARPP